MRFVLLFLVCLLTAGCLGTPPGVEPVGNFEVQRYLGRWYEIARLDHSFERGLTHVTATYQLREDGGLQVINRGYAPEEKTWQQAEGKAYFVDERDRGYLKVSFFGPFYGSYVIFELDHDDYAYAYVCGPDTSYLWLLARTPHVSHARTQAFIERAGELGFATDQLIFVEHTAPGDDDS